MNQLDVLLLVLFLPFTFRGYFRGLCREIFGLAGSIAGVVAAGAVGPAAAKVLLDEHLAPPVAAHPLGWAVVFVGTWVVAALLGRIADRLASALLLGGRGRSAVGLCPFHAEKTPSFTVSEERGFFHCFGCGEHGDVFAFLMKAQALTFPEAVRRVAERFGVPLPEEAGEPARRREPLAAANAVAAAFFQAELRGPGGGRARAYLRERGLSEEVIERFGLGWAPGAGEALARHLRTKGLPLEDALTAGLVMRRDRPDGAGGVLDRFRDRRIFPVFLEAGLWGRGAFLPAAEDPDTFVRAQGRAALEGLLAAAEPLVEAFVGELAGAKRDAVGRHAEAAREVARLLKRVREPH